MYLILPILFLNIIFMNKMDNKNLTLYSNIQKNVIVLSFLYLVCIFIISISNNNIYIKAKHVGISLIIILILPMIIFNIIKFKNISVFLPIIKLKLIKIFNITYCIISILIVLFYFFNKENYLNKYSFNIIIYLTFIYFLINYTKKEEF